MADIVSPAKRSRMMAGIRGKNTKPEILVRRMLHRLGYRFRLHRNDLAGKPDVVLPKCRTAVFVNGCYWHGHANCHLFRLPKSRTEFWSKKIKNNRLRDLQNYTELEAAGWKVIVIWECAVAKKNRLSVLQLEDMVNAALASKQMKTEIRGKSPVGETQTVSVSY